jgi:phosphatidylserine/phosphatidylglycerophosphate/cardiolipin synthase-like enzyme
MDAVHNGPICKHAAACLLVEARRNKPTFQERRAAAVLSGIALLQDTVDGNSSGFTKLKIKPPLMNSWMVEIFRHLVTRSRANPAVAEIRKPGLLLAIKGVEEDEPKRRKARAPVGVPQLPLVLPGALPFIAGERMNPIGGNVIDFLNGAEAQDAVISEIQRSSPEAVIRLMAYTFDYPPLVVALCTAKAATPGRRIEIVMDRGNTLSGPTKSQNAMARQLMEAGVNVRFAAGKRLSAVYDEAQRPGYKLGGLMGALHAKACIVGNHAFVGSTNWTVSSRANNECSVHILLNEVMAATFHAFIDRVWSGAEIIDINKLIEKNAERLRVQALNKLEKARHSKTS